MKGIIEMRQVNYVIKIQLEYMTIDAAENIIFHINDSGQISKVKGVSKSAIS